MTARRLLPLALLCLLCLPSAGGAAPLQLHELRDYVPLGYYLHVLEDPSR
jgi:hypothetical protein